MKKYNWPCNGYATTQERLLRLQHVFISSPKEILYERHSYKRGRGVGGLRWEEKEGIIRSYGQNSTKL
jgi:hypothetical protein